MDTERKKGGIEGEGTEEGGINIMAAVVVGYATLKRVCSYFHLWWAAVSMQMLSPSSLPSLKNANITGAAYVQI